MKALIFTPAVFSLVFLFSTDAAKAQTLPTRFSQVLVANGISDPTVMAFAPDGRIFVAQQTGQLRIIKNGTLLAQPFISLPVNSSGERGLLGIAFDPNFNTNKYIYLYYTLASAANNRISRFTANGDIVVAGSERVVLELDPLSSANNHNGGTMQFGPDGKLYVGVGDNADAVNAQIFDTYHGKILRINADGSVPAGNPFTTGSAQQQRLWSYGLRNPFTIAFQPGTGKLLVNDVGGSTWEEINDATANGQNFGWPYSEGGGSSYSNPLYEYGHGTSIGTGCAITGGSFFNPSSTPYPTTYFGKYFFLDYCGNWIDMLTLSGGLATRSNFASNIAGSPVSLVTGTDGNLYFLSRDNSAVYKITYTSSSAPVITNQPQSLTVAQGNTATFKVSVTGGLPFSYQWRKDSANISGATSSSYTISSVSAASAGTYSVVISNAFGNVTSKNATLTVTSPNKPPVATITTPVTGATYAGGTVINFSGTATDPENGALAANAYKWFVTFHHGTHTHPGPTAVTGGATGSFTIPTTGETATDVFYRLYLVVTDPQGAKDTVYKDIRPRTSFITLYTNPQGLNITLDGQPYTSPLTITSVEGILRTIGTTSPQTFKGLTYKYGSWSQGGAQTQKIATPVNNMVYTATFNSVVVITKQPQNLTAIQGKNATFTVLSTGTAPISYQWRKNGISISGATSYSYTIPTVTTAHAGTYSVVVSNGAGSTISSNATLTVITPPVITKQPQNFTAIQGKTATFMVTSTGTSPFSYQWRRNGINISGATSYSYTIVAATTANAGTYSVVVSNAAGFAVSTNTTLTVVTPPVITKPPQSLSVIQGKTATFTVISTGTAPFSYLWRKNGINISGATSSSYTIPSATTANAGTYSVFVSNAAGNTISSNATLTVVTPPVISKPPQNLSVILGKTATFTVTSTGTAPFNYQWRKNGINISGATGSSYTIPSATTANAGTYSVFVSNAAGNTISSNAILTVVTPPVITIQPQSLTVIQGNTATFSVTSTGTAPFTYQWRKNGINISGANSSSYTIPSATTANAGTYFVVVGNAAGSAISSNATLGVVTPPVITKQPQDLAVIQGKTATFTVISTGTAPLSYQWRKNGISISGATGSSYTIASATTANAGTYSVAVTNAFGSVISLNATLTITTGDTAYTIFQPAAEPASPINNDGQGIELGVRFRSTQNGFITGIRYYKGAGTTGTHIGHLWSNAGVLLGAATFTNDTVPGWQQVLFSSPVAITAGVTYVASQFSPSGDYSSSVNYFTQAVINGPLRALADGEDGINGVYNYSTAPVFPTSGNLSSNYWVDVVFTAASGTDLRSITIQQQQTQQQQQLNVNLHKNSVDRFAINELYVNVMPNPSNTFFNLVIKGNNQSLVTVRVFDISGRLIEKQEKIASSSTLQLGYKWISGSYIVEVIQGDQRKFMKIIKVN